MTIEHDEHKPRIVWSSANERLAVVAMLCVLQLAVIVGVIVLGVGHELDKASITAILGTIAGGSGTAIVHKLGQRG